MSTTDRRPRLVHLLAGGAAAVALTGALAGCSSTSPAGSAPTVTTTVSAPAAAASTSTAATATATGSAASTPAASPSSSSFRSAGCATSDLSGSLQAEAGGAAAGSTYYDLVLENTGSSPCTLQGWPGTSLVDSSGRQVGAAADFDRSTAHETVTLIPNAHAVARLQVAQALNFPSSKCAPVKASRLKVYPPGSTASLTFSISSVETCSDSGSHVLTVGALHAAS